jgi:hypothetical protein
MLLGWVWGFFTFYSREDGTGEMLKFVGTFFTSEQQSKMQWRHNCVNQRRRGWVIGYICHPAMTVLRGIAPMPSAIVIDLANATPLSLHDMQPAHSSLQPPTTTQTDTVNLSSTDYIM